MGSRNIQARRKLSALYDKGVEVRFDSEGGRLGPFVDDDGKPIALADGEVAMWIQPPSPLQRDMALREAQAQRARSLLRVMRDSQSEEYLTAQVQVAEMDDATLVDYILMQQSEQHRQEAVRDVLGRDEWADFTQYQDGFRQYDEAKVKALDSGMTEEDWENSPEHAEFSDLLELDKKYGDQVSQRQLEITHTARQVLEMYPRERVESMARDLRKEVVGSQAFIEEYTAQMLFYACRDIKSHDQLFFDSVTEYREQSNEVQTTVQIAVQRFVGEVAEAKNSSGAAAGSASSEPLSKQETSAVSIPEAANG